MVDVRTLVAISEAGAKIVTIQGLLAGGMNEAVNLPDSIERLAHMVELRIFAAAFYEKDNAELNEAERKAAKIMEKAAAAAKLLREIDCEIDRLHASCLAVQ